MHREFEWPDFYSSTYLPELKMFFDRYCKGIRNGWESTSRVRIEVQDASTSLSRDCRSVAQ